MSEATLLKQITLAVGRRYDTRVFRNNVGAAWMGSLLKLERGTAVINHAHKASFGLHKGSADLIGWRSVEIRPEHVGQLVAVFLSIEVKTPGSKPRPEQLNWLDQVAKAGGIACIAHSIDEAEAAVISGPVS